MKANSRLPMPMIVLAYLAAGIAISVSWAQLRQVLSMQAGLNGGEFIEVALPFALLFGGAVLWRMGGHLISRTAEAKTFAMALCLVLAGAVFIEGISVFTSAISLNLGVNNRLQQDVEATAAHQANARISAASALAAERLAADLNRMPSNYITGARRTGEALADLIQQQKELTHITAATSESSSATARTLAEVGAGFGLTGDELKRRWSWLIAIGLSVIVLGVQFGLGSCSDGAQIEKRRELDVMTDISEDQPAKKRQSLYAVG